MSTSQAAVLDIRCMKEALMIGLRGIGAVSPNPVVGAVLVKDGEVIARGWHHSFGGPHAEIDCLQRARGRAKGATLYVSLEPCSHHGKTPPCVEAIISAGIHRVVVGLVDPNPLVSGRGLRRLRSAGIAITTAVCQDDARFLNRQFTTHIVQRRPYVHVKLAQTLDSRITRRSGNWISGPFSRRIVHQWRAGHDAVLVGAGTVLADRPTLDVRLVKGRDPHVIVLDGRFRLGLPDLLRLRKKDRRVIVCTTRKAMDRRQEDARTLARGHIEVVAFPSRSRRISLGQLLQEFYAWGIGSILVEGGRGVASAFSASEFVDEFSVFLAPDLFGSGLTAFESRTKQGDVGPGNHFGTMAAFESGEDVLVRAFRKRFLIETLRTWHPA